MTRAAPFRNNLELASRYSEGLYAGALAVELWDALRGNRLAQPLIVTVDDKGTELPKRKINLHALVFTRGLKPTVTLRFDDPTRTFVPRRLTYPIIPQIIPPADEPNPGWRIRRTFFYPGATYGYASGATGVRGTLKYAAGGAPVRWARVEAYLGTDLVGRTHGDDRGEFLLLFEQGASGAGPLPTDITVDLQFYAAAAAPAPSVYASDRLADLPVETVGAAVLDDTDPDQVTYLPKPDAIALGETPPGTLHTFNPRQSVTVPLGRVESKVISI
jgi:hypothetical protein